MENNQTGDDAPGTTVECPSDSSAFAPSSDYSVGLEGTWNAHFDPNTVPSFMMSWYQENLPSKSDLNFTTTCGLYSETRQRTYNGPFGQFRGPLTKLTIAVQMSSLHKNRKIVADEELQKWTPDNAANRILPRIPDNEEREALCVGADAVLKSRVMLASWAEGTRVFPHIAPSGFR